MFTAHKFKVIKSIGNKHYEVSLLESERGTYFIHKIRNTSEQYSDSYADLATALHVFEVTLLEMEGN